MPEQPRIPKGLGTSPAPYFVRGRGSAEPHGEWKQGTGEMFQSWRFKLREADTAYRQGRYDEAIRLLAERETGGPLPGRRLADRLVESIADRARSRMIAGDMTEAWKDYQRIVQFAGDCETAVQLRDELADSVVSDAKSLVEAGDFDRAIAKLDDLIRRGSVGESVVSLRETIRRVRSADQLAKRGKFAAAIEQLKYASVADESGRMGLSERLDEYRRRQGVGRELGEKLHRAMIHQEWTAAATTAEQLLEIAPLSALARDARKQAWAQAGTHLRQTHAPGTQVPAAEEAGSRTGDSAKARSSADVAVIDNPENTKTAQLVEDRQHSSSSRQSHDPHTEQLRSFFVWVDGVGGYLVCPTDTVIIGQAVPGADVDIPVLGDVSRRHATIRRSGEGYVLEALAETSVNGKAAERPVVIRDGDRLQLGPVELVFRQPHALSSTARLDFLSRHGTQPSADGVILLADSCVLGPRRENHIVCQDWEHDVVFFRRKERLYCRAVASFEVDGELVDGHAHLAADSRIAGDDFSLSLEPIQRQ